MAALLPARQSRARAIGATLGVPPDLAQTSTASTVCRFLGSRIWSSIEPRDGRDSGAYLQSWHDVVEEAAGFLLAKELAGRGVKVLVFDPAYGIQSPATMHDNVHFAANAADCIARSDVVVLATSWPEFERDSRPSASEPPTARCRTIIRCGSTVKMSCRLMPRRTIARRIFSNSGQEVARRRRVGSSDAVAAFAAK